MFENIINGNHFFLVAGPCSAESQQQLGDTCQALMETERVDLLRCGVWKPRTRPGGFEGKGEDALGWIAELKRQHPSWRFAIEVVTPQHVDLAMRYGVDALWIGARTTGNPFLVSDLAQALKHNPVPIMVKNPMNADAKLWMGALERLQYAGINDIAAIHRGFSTSSPIHPELRNDPVWRVPLELRSMMPHVPLLCDPSHMAGCVEKITECSQTALNLDFDGLMVECHIHPKQALTDALQQMTPAELVRMLGTLTFRPHSATTPLQLSLLREQLKLVDEDIMKLFAQRLDLSREIAVVKETYNIATYQPSQWSLKLREMLLKAEKMGLNKKFVESVFEKIHLESIRVQEESRTNG
ncbi:MAG: chorismate mutase [Bacteroidales bacterium]|nr:chorismate mutase [Bacteroidales bacterium]